MWSLLVRCESVWTRSTNPQGPHIGLHRRSKQAPSPLSPSPTLWIGGPAGGHPYWLGTSLCLGALVILNRAVQQERPLPVGDDAGWLPRLDAESGQAQARRMNPPVNWFMDGTLRRFARVQSIWPSQDRHIFPVCHATAGSCARSGPATWEPSTQASPFSGAPVRCTNRSSLNHSSAQEMIPLQDRRSGEDHTE